MNDQLLVIGWCPDPPGQHDLPDISAWVRQLQRMKNLCTHMVKKRPRKKSPPAAGHPARWCFGTPRHRARHGAPAAEPVLLIVGSFTWICTPTPYQTSSSLLKHWGALFSGSQTGHGRRDDHSCQHDQ